MQPEVTDHDHCNQCINWSKCLRRNRRQSSCPIISCDFKCGARFHFCKNDEHLILCPEVMVPCLNASFGCQIKLLRKNTGKHLAHCPASVVHCSIEWNRWPLQTTCRPLDFLTFLPHQRLPTNKQQSDRDTNRKSTDKIEVQLQQSLDAVALNENQLDVALTLRDQRLIQELSQLDTEIRCLLCNPLTRLNPTLPIQPYWNLPQNDSDQVPNCPVPNKTWSDLYANLILDLNFDAIAPFQPKPKQMFTFKCAQNFRRDEYAAHYHNVHSDIQGTLPGWFDRRCPRWQYGCPESFTTISPYPFPSQIVYSTLLESFGHLIACTDLDHTYNDTCNQTVPKTNQTELDTNRKRFPLMKLPPEIIDRIVSYLDGFSINNVALTCRTLRQICARLLKKHGLVCLAWKRDESIDSKRIKWKVDKYRWCFSNSMHEIHEWKLLKNDRFLNHVQKCSYGETNRSNEPIYLKGIGSSFYREINQEQLTEPFSN